MKPFPKELTELPAVEELTGPLKAALKRFYTMRRTKEQSAPYEGYALHYSVSHCSPQPDAELSEKNVKYHADRGRDPLDIILGLAVQLGISTGYIMGAGNYERLNEIITELRGDLDELRKLKEEK